MPSVRSICIVSAQRTGSNMLASMFPEDQFIDLGEVFNEQKFRGKLFDHLPSGKDSLRALRYDDPAAFLDQVLTRPDYFDGRIPVWNYQYQNIFRTGPESWKAPLLSAVRGRSDIGIIHLTRQDLVARYVSLVRADATRHYSFKGSQSKLAAVHIDPKACGRDIRRTKRMQLEVQALFSGPLFCNVLYEDLVRSPAPIARKLTEALGTAIELEPAKTRRQSHALHEDVANFEALMRDLGVANRSHGDRLSHIPARSRAEFYLRMFALRHWQSLRARFFRIVQD